MPVARRTRVAARVVTGPIGHLYGGLADVVVLVARELWSRARGIRAARRLREPPVSS